MPPKDFLSFHLGLEDLRTVAGYAAECALYALPVFEMALPKDTRPRLAIEAAQAFSSGTRRGKALRDCAWAAHHAAQDALDADETAAAEAARASLAAAASGFLHPLPKATQVRHILGAAGHAALAIELSSPENQHAGMAHIVSMASLAPPCIVRVLLHYPSAPTGGGPVGEMIRQLDALLRLRSLK